MKKFVLFHPGSGKYVSHIYYNRRVKQYDILFTYRLYEAKVWNSRKDAEAQAQRIFVKHSDIALEVKEIK